MILVCFQVKWSQANIKVKLMTANWQTGMESQEQVEGPVPEFRLFFIPGICFVITSSAFRD